jgi:hypothetical protein
MRKGPTSILDAQLIPSASLKINNSISHFLILSIATSNCFDVANVAFVFVASLSLLVLPVADAH